MLRAVLDSLFGRSKKATIKTSPRRARFAPALQALEPREVPALVAYPTVAEVVLPDADTSDAAVVSTDDTSAATGKVKFQDFNFTAKVSKSSPIFM